MRGYRGVHFLYRETDDEKTTKGSPVKGHGQTRDAFHRYAGRGPFLVR